MLWMITDFTYYASIDDAFSRISAVLTAGAAHVSLRHEAEIPDRDIFALCGRLQKEHPRKNIFLHETDPAVAPFCSCFHFRSTALPRISEIRERFSDRRIAVSTHSRQEYEDAFAAGADYVFYSPVFPPFSKKNDTRPTITPVKRKNLYLLGGINTIRAARLIRDGYCDIAGISLFLGENALGDTEYLSALLNHYGDE